MACGVSSLTPLDRFRGVTPSSSQHVPEENGGGGVQRAVEELVHWGVKWLLRHFLVQEAQQST